MTIQLAFILATILTLAVVEVVYGFFQNTWFEIKRKRSQILEKQKFKELNLIIYPKDLETDEQIKLYIRKNYKSFPNAEEWGDLLVDMIREMTIAGWNTEISIYVKYKYRTYHTHLITDNLELQYRLYDIAHKYEEIYDTKDL